MWHSSLLQHGQTPPPPQTRKEVLRVVIVVVWLCSSAYKTVSVSSCNVHTHIHHHGCIPNSCNYFPVHVYKPQRNSMSVRNKNSIWKKLKIYIFFKERKNVTKCNTVQHNKCMSKTLLGVKHWRNESSICTELGSFDNHCLPLPAYKKYIPYEKIRYFFLANIEKNHVSPTLTRGRKKHK